MSTAEIKLTNLYWEILRFLSDDVKLRLASMLTSSVVDRKENVAARQKSVTEMMVRKYAGAVVEDRSTEEINVAINSMRSSKPVQQFSL